MDSPFSGVVYTDRNGSLTHLSLEEVSVDALVVDVSAKVTIRQVFSHPLRGASARAKYVFPLPARAAACAFEMRTGKGRRIIGVVKEKVQAIAEHEEALKQGKTTALVEWATDDIFTVSLGSIPGEQTITTVLTYVMDLLDDDSEKQIRFQIPMYVGQRYGDLPPEMVHALSPSKQTRIRFNVQVQTKGQIRPQDVNSPSHPAISVARYQTHLGRPSRHRITVKYRSRQFLDKDFVLRVQAAGLELPRCFLERDDRGTVAMQLTLMPHFELPPVAAQEYIFLVDRSRSMGGSRIGTAKRTLILLLRTLPSEHTIFNIFSFGSTCDSLWESSRPYAQAALENASTYVDGMDANYPGTEIRAALQVTLRTRSRTLSTALFVLTDGESYDVDETLELVANEVARSPATAPLRVFTLGIGDTASNAMCEGIARAGNGVCLMTTTAEGIIGKCSKLVRTGRTFLLKNVTIDWGIQLDRDASPSVRFTAMDQVVRQAPSHIESIYAGVRLIVFAIIKSDKFVAPREISLHAQRDGGGDTLEFKIPVEQVKFSEDNVRNRLVHTLAARRLIMELDDPALRQSLPEEERVQSIVRLGEQYQLASRYTSFTAVDGVETEVIPPRASRRVRPGSSSDTRDFRDVFEFAVSAAMTFIETWFGPPPRALRVENEMPGGDGQARAASPSGQGRDEEEDNDEGGESDNTFTTLSSLVSGTSSDWSDAGSRAPSPPPDDLEFARSPSPELVLPERPEQAGLPGLDYATAAPPPLDRNVEQLVRLQCYDGSFVPDDTFKNLVGQNALEEGHRHHLDDRLWATVLALAYFEKHLIGEPDLLDSLMEKALGFTYRLQSGLPPALSIPHLLERARQFV